MSKYSKLLFDLIAFAAILNSGQRVLANEKIKAIEQKNEGKDWIEELKEEIRAVDQENYIKDEIKAEELSKNKGSGKKIFNEIGTGLSEKGIYLDFIKNSNAKNKLGIRVNYLPEDFFTHKNIYVDDRNVKAEYFGVASNAKVLMKLIGLETK